MKTTTNRITSLIWVLVFPIAIGLAGCSKKDNDGPGGENCHTELAALSKAFLDANVAFSTNSNPTTCAEVKRTGLKFYEKLSTSSCGKAYMQSIGMTTDIEQGAKELQETDCSEF